MWTQHLWCLVCSVTGTMDHAWLDSRFHHLACDVIAISMGPFYHKDTSYVCWLLPQYSTLRAPQGILFSAGRAVHWAVRNSASFHQVPCGCKFCLNTWVSVVVEWRPLSGWANTFVQFQQSPCHLQQVGALPLASVPIKPREMHRRLDWPIGREKQNLQWTEGGGKPKRHSR